VTTGGVARLGALPRLRRLSLDGLQGVGKEVISRFGGGVRVSYSG
jgi:hypothetical protein